jgi:hypothetical protein
MVIWEIEIESLDFLINDMKQQTLELTAAVDYKVNCWRNSPLGMSGVTDAI